MNARPLHFAKRSNTFTLFPSKDNSPTAAAKETYNAREIIAQAAANATQQTLPSESTKGTTLVLAKPFEYFPTPSGDHSLCYFDLKNNSLRPVAYKVTTNRPELYEIAPDGAWIPPGRTWSISVKYAGNSMAKERLQNDRIIVTTFSQLRFSGQNPIDEFLRVSLCLLTLSASYSINTCFYLCFHTRLCFIVRELSSIFQCHVPCEGLCDSSMLSTATTLQKYQRSSIRSAAC